MNDTKKPWWKDAVFYQIYPRSFYDSDNNGIGDLKGITEKLDFLSAEKGGLGVDAIWISPFFTSPMKDFGYDVSDYMGIDPIFGTMEDFDELLKACHEKGMKLMIDLVLNHSSDQHPWFLESQKDRTNPKNDWYVWHDGKPDGSPPNNWKNVFSGNAWTWVESRKQYYMHSFLKEQPDLNWYNPEVQEEIRKVLRFWLEKGVDGFRLDTANFYAFDRELRDNPKRDTSKIAVEDKNVEYNLYDPTFSKDRPENIEFLKLIRSEIEKINPEATTIGEIGGIHDPEKLSQVSCECVQGNDRLHMVYNFSLLGENLTAKTIHEIILLNEKYIGDGWPSWSLGNHDCKRLASRVGEGNRELKQSLLIFLLCMKGSPILYYGDEVDIPEAQIPFEQMQDPFGILNYPTPVGRDGCRTPFPWHAGKPSQGFNQGKEPWLPFAKSPALNETVGIKGSTYELLKEFLSFRKNHSALRSGEYRQIVQDEETLSIVIKNSEESFRLIVNFSQDQWASVSAPQIEPIRFNNQSPAPEQEGNLFKIPPQGFGLFKS